MFHCGSVGSGLVFFLLLLFSCLHYGFFRFDFQPLALFSDEIRSADKVEEKDDLILTGFRHLKTVNNPASSGSSMQ